MKVCAEPGCPNIQAESRCPTHTRQRDRSRGTRTQRGYGADHARLRARWAPLVATGLVACTRCHLLIGPGEPWHLDHTDDRTGYRGPSHARCNVSAGGKAAHR